MGRESAWLVVPVTGRTLSPAVLIRGWPSAWGTAMGTGLWALRISMTTWIKTLRTCFRDNNNIATLTEHLQSTGHCDKRFPLHYLPDFSQHPDKGIFLFIVFEQR